MFLLAAPGAAIDAWPWRLTTVLARTYAGIFLALALGAFLATRESRAAALAPFLATSFVFSVCGLAVYGLHHSRFDGSTATVIWLAAHSLAAVAFGSALLALGRRVAVAPKVAAPAGR